MAEMVVENGAVDGDAGENVHSAPGLTVEVDLEDDLGKYSEGSSSLTATQTDSQTMNSGGPLQCQETSSIATAYNAAAGQSTVDVIMQNNMMRLLLCDLSNS